jgi:predicted dehydrogenase
VTVTMSFDVPKHKHAPIEIYGDKASLLVPDPNYFGGDIEYAGIGEDWRTMPTQHAYADGNYRIIGVADMAHAILADRPHRASGALAFHVLEVMEAFQRSSDSGAVVAIESRPDRPAMLPVGLAAGALD